MIIHLATLVLACRYSLFHYPQWSLTFPWWRIFLASYPLAPSKWALQSMDRSDFSALYFPGYRDPLKGFGLSASHDFNSRRTHLVTNLERPAETAGLAWVGKRTTINLFFAAELAPCFWHLTGSRKRHQMTILSPAAWASEAFGFTLLRPNIIEIPINLNCRPYA